MRAAMAAGLLVLLVSVSGCGGSRTFGQAAEEWCHAHYPKPEAAASRCFEVVTNHGPNFLRKIERGEMVKAEVERLRALHAHP